MNNREKHLVVTIAALVVAYVLVIIIGGSRMDNLEKTIDESNKKIESLESEFEEKTDALIDLGWEDEIKLERRPIRI